MDLASILGQVAGGESSLAALMKETQDDVEDEEEEEGDDDTDALLQHTPSSSAAASSSSLASLLQQVDETDTPPVLAPAPTVIARPAPPPPPSTPSVQGIPSPRVNNVVATVNLKVALVLGDIAQKARNAEYNPKRFSAVIMRIKEPKTTALIFKSGKLVVAGARSEKDAKIAARKFARIVQKLGYKGVKFSEFKVRNLVANCGVGFPIKLEELAYEHSLFANYEPELYPGLIYRMHSPKVVLLIFVSGKIVFTGAQSKEDLLSAVNKIYPVLCEFKKVVVPKQKLLKRRRKKKREEEEEEEEEDSSE